MSDPRRLVTGVIVLILSSAMAWAAPDPRLSLEQVVARISEREKRFVTNLRGYSPLIETYIQHLGPDPELGAVPAGDEYFLGRLDFSRGPASVSFVGQKGSGGWLRRLFGPITGSGGMKFSPDGFATVVLDERGLDSGAYEFTFVRREFLGEVRCLVIDVAPKKNSGQGRFLGRMWVEDQEYNIVRFNGTYTPRPRFGYYFHFDSWRLNLRPGIWLPAYIYTEEKNLKYGVLPRTMAFKAQTRLWGYNLQRSAKMDEFTDVIVEPSAAVDKSESGEDLSPVQSMRAWQRQAEENVLERLERAGLLARAGDVDKVLKTVVSNLEISNKLDIQPEVQCRVLLTAPLESFSIGNTIVVSRGLLDVLPDEATLAAILAHELAHILLGHGADSGYAFSDRMLFADEQTFRRLRLGHNPNDEQAADAKAMELLKNSPYKDQLANAGLFLRALQQRAQQLPNLIRAHLGNGLMTGEQSRLSELIASAPPLEMQRMDQIAALPIGARIKVDPWSDRVEMSKAKPVALLSPREKLFFEVTPIFPYLSRLGPKAREAKPATEKAATNDPQGN